MASESQAGIELQPANRPAGAEQNMAQEGQGRQTELRARALPYPPHVCLEWTRHATESPTKICEGQAVYLDRCVYVGGGKCKEKNDEKVVFKLDLANNAWVRLQPCSNRSFTLVSHERKILAIAGTEDDGSYSNTVCDWSADATEWSNTYGSITTPRANASAVSHRDHVIVAGGKGQQMFMLSVEVYSPTTKRWSTVASLPSPLFSPASAVLNDPRHGPRWFLLGGPKQGKAVYMALLDSLIDSASSDQACATEYPWTVMESLGTESFCSSVVSIGGTAIIAIGGKKAVSGSQTKVMAFTLEHCKWFEVHHPLPDKCYSAAAVAISENEVMVIGGTTRARFRDHIFKGALVRSPYAEKLSV